MIRIAFFDIDGTLVDMKTHTMGEKTREALLRLKNNGIRIIIATGRPLFRVPELHVPFDGYISFNGSLCTDGHRKVIYAHTIPHQDVIRLIENGKKIGRPCAIASDREMGANGMDDDLAEYFAIGGQTLAVRRDFDAFLERSEIYQVMMGGRKEEYPSILKGVAGAEITYWWDRAVDIIPKGSGKDIGVEKMLEHFGFTAEEAMAFGDGGNDLSMLKSVRAGTAMGNAAEEVKRQVPYVCGPCAEDGIYTFCLAHHLI